MVAGESDAGAGANTCTYVVDTGIYAQHVEFGGRASNLFDVTGEGPADGNGHGTHVAGIAGSAAYGVAKRTSLFGVKVGSPLAPLSGSDISL